jgi:hypothetical protein
VKTSLDFASQAHKIVFPKNTFLVQFFYETTPHQFSGPNGLYDAIGSKLFRSEVSFFQKNTFTVRIFLRNRPLNYFWGQTHIARLGAKLFRMKTSLDFASKTPEIVFPQSTFSVRIFLTKPPPHLFSGQMDNLAHLGEKLLWVKTSLNFASTEIVFPQNTFLV